MSIKTRRAFFLGSSILLNGDGPGRYWNRCIGIPRLGKSQSIFNACLSCVIYLFIWMGSGCAGSTASLTIVCGTCEEPGRFVRLQTQQSRSPFVAHREFTHPVQLSPQDLRPVLASIRVRPVIGFLRKGDGEPAFTSEEIEYLSMTLGRAFARASSREWVVFGLKHSDASPLAKMTTGGWYVQGTTLHLLLPNFQAPVPFDNLGEVLDRDPWFEVLEATRYEFLPTEYSMAMDGKTSSLSFLREEVPHLAIEYQALLARRTRTQETKGEKEAEIGGGNQVNPEGGDPLSPGIVHRLATLKRLREQHLITEEDYQMKKKALLDEY